jgi:transcriptional regulator with XRE-family HTH domain
MQQGLLQSVLLTLRVRRSLSLDQVASDIGVSERKLRKIERGEVDLQNVPAEVLADWILRVGADEKLASAALARSLDVELSRSSLAEAAGTEDHAARDQATELLKQVQSLLAKRKS